MFKHALTGIRVTDFSWVGAGPLTTRFLAECGAEVIKIETHKRPEILRVAPPFKDKEKGIERSGYFSSRNPNKKSLSINMNHTRAREVVVPLIEKSDIVINSFKAGQMEKWGLGYEDLKKVKPDIIYVDMPPWGNVGPYIKYKAFGALINSVTGFNYLSGNTDGFPIGTGTNYTDHIPVPTHLAFAIVVALRHRRKTGEGQYIEMPQMQAGIAVTSAVALMDYAANGRIQSRMGCRHLSFAPHGVYKVKGDRKWIAIAVFNNQEWVSLKECMGNPRWAEDQKFATDEGRLANRDELDAQLEKWSSEQDGEELMFNLQKMGVRSGLVYNAKEVIIDIQLQSRGFFVYLDHPEVGITLYTSSPVRMSKTPPGIRKHAPLLGQNTFEVLKNILQLDEAAITELQNEGVLE